MYKFKLSIRVLPIAASLLAALLIDLSCSQPPAPMAKISSKTSNATPKTKDTSEIGEDDTDEDGNGDANKGEEEVGETEEPIQDEPNMGVPTIPDPPKFVPCTEQAEKCSPHQMILADYAIGRVIYVNLDDPSKDWNLDVPGRCRDLQLIGDNKVLIGTGEGAGPFGWHEVDIATGKIVKSVTGITGAVMSVQRVLGGNTLLIGPNLLGGQGAVVVEVNDKKEIVSKKQFPGNNFRTVRRSFDGHFFIGNGSDMVEYTADGTEVWRSNVGAQPAYMGLKLPNGVRVIASGHGGKIFTYDAASGKVAKTVALPNIDSSATHMPAFASAFAILPNGNYVATNWSGSGPDHGKDGPQVQEYTPDGKVVWTWKQQADRISAIYAVLVLDNLDLSKPHDDSKGPLEPLSLAYP